jgi:type IV pilus assembly protein PilC
MPQFFYKAWDRHSLSHFGHLEAVNEEEVVGMLHTRGLIVTRLSRREDMAQTAQAARQRIGRNLHSRVTIDDKVIFCQQLAVLLEAGIPLLKSLEVLCVQIESRPLLVAIQHVRQDIEAGKTFREALGRYPAMFSSFWLNLVETGEASGHLAQSLNQLARYLEAMRSLQRKALTAMTYPIVLMVGSAIAVSVFLLKIIPSMSTLLLSLNVQLPLLTRIVIGASEIARHYFLLVVALLVAAGIMLRRALRTEGGRWMLDGLLLQIPVFKHLFIQLQLSHFARGLSTLLESGVPILFGLEIMETSAVNKHYGRAIGQVKEHVREGKPMAEPMERSGFFPPMVVQMIQVGEEIGELGKMLNRIANYYEERVDTFIQRLSQLFEPIAIGVMAVVIGILVVSMFLPIFSIAGGSQIK